jgi:hypothetical protein
LLQRFIDALADVSKVDQPMRMEGRFLGVMLAPDVKKATKRKEPAKAVTSADQPATEKQDETETQVDLKE